jgi:type I restriction enzyme, S subunit
LKGGSYILNQQQIKEKNTIKYPTDWKAQLLGEIGEFIKGKGISKREIKVNGIPCILYGEIYTDHHVLVRKFKSFIDQKTALKSTRIKKGDLLFTGSGETKEEIGKAVAFLGDVEAYAGGDIIILRPNKSVNSLYLSYALNSEELIKKRARLGQGHSVVHIYPKELKNIKIYLPPLPEQQKIASILSIWDKAIALKEKLIEQKKEQKKGLMQKLLTGEVRLPGFKNEWKSIKLGNLIKEVKEKSTVNNQFPVLSVTKNGIVAQEEHFNKQVASKNNIGYKIVRKNNLVFSTMNLWMGSLDVLTTYNIGIVSPAYKVFELNYQRFHPTFAKYFMQSEFMIWLYKVNSEQGASIVRRNLDLKGLLNTLVTIPPLNEQIEIAKLLINSDREIDLLVSEYELLKQQKKGLMQLLLTGKVRVKV